MSSYCLLDVVKIKDEPLTVPFSVSLKATSVKEYEPVLTAIFCQSMPLLYETSKIELPMQVGQYILLPVTKTLDILRVEPVLIMLQLFPESVVLSKTPLEPPI